MVAAPAINESGADEVLIADSSQNPSLLLQSSEVKLIPNFGTGSQRHIKISKGAFRLKNDKEKLLAQIERS